MLQHQGLTNPAQCEFSGMTDRSEITTCGFFGGAPAASSCNHPVRGVADWTRVELPVQQGIHAWLNKGLRTREHGLIRHDRSSQYAGGAQLPKRPARQQSQCKVRSRYTLGRLHQEIEPDYQPHLLSVAESSAQSWIARCAQGLPYAGEAELPQRPAG